MIEGDIFTGYGWTPEGREIAKPELLQAIGDAAAQLPEYRRDWSVGQGIECENGPDHTWFVVRASWAFDSFIYVDLGEVEFRRDASGVITELQATSYSGKPDDRKAHKFELGRLEDGDLELPSIFNLTQLAVRISRNVDVDRRDRERRNRS